MTSPEILDFRQNTPEKKYPLRHRYMAAAAIMLATVSGQNYQTVQAYYPFFGDGDAVPQIHGCEIDPDHRSAMVPEVDDVSSAARNFESAGIMPLETINTIRTFFDHPQDSFTSEISGLQFDFYSDTPHANWEIDHKAFDQVFHFALTTDYPYEHEGVKEAVSCLRERIIDDQEFAGESYAVYIPSNPRSCLGNGRIIDLDDDPNAKCHQRGFAPPHIDISVLGIEVFKGNIMVLTGGRNDNGRDNSIKRLAFHESIHAHTNLPGEKSFRVDANEKWVKYQERVLLRETAKAYDELQPFISFLEPGEKPLQAVQKERLQNDFTEASTNKTKTE